jgi:hypothetical protein
VKLQNICVTSEAKIFGAYVNLQSFYRTACLLVIFKLGEDSFPYLVAVVSAVDEDSHVGEPHQLQDISRSVLKQGVVTSVVARERETYVGYGVAVHTSVAVDAERADQDAHEESRQYYEAEGIWDFLQGRNLVYAYRQKVVDGIVVGGEQHDQRCEGQLTKS